MTERYIHLDGHSADNTHVLFVTPTGPFLSIEHIEGDLSSYFELSEDQARALRDTINAWLGEI